jgi:hypothetical protein
LGTLPESTFACWISGFAFLRGGHTCFSSLLLVKDVIIYTHYTPAWGGFQGKG